MRETSEMEKRRMQFELTNMKGTLIIIGNHPAGLSEFFNRLDILQHLLLELL